MCHVSEDCRSPAQFATAPNQCPAFTSGPGSKDLSITVQRGTSSDTNVGTSLFTVVVPTVTGVEPSFGPVSGGTSITI